MKLIFLLIIIGECATGFSQLQSRQVVCSSGAISENGVTNYSYSVGEAIVHTGTLSNNIVNTGFQQSMRVIPDPLTNLSNVFSPNDDGINDNWQIQGIDEFPDNKVSIYNRWGDLIYTVNGYDNVLHVWNGRRENQLVPSGTYFYVIEIGAKRETGWLQVLY